jgi:hypothetical protein
MFKLRASSLLDRHSYHLSHSASPFFSFDDGFFQNRVLAKD